MEKEIFEQPQVLDAIVKKYCPNGEILIDFPGNFERIKFIASGSSYNCARLAQKFFCDIGGFEGASEFSSEFLANKNLKIDKNTLYFFISQSGETSDTLAVLNLVQQACAKTFVITNNENSTMQKLSKYGICACAGEENAIAATKSFSACILCAWLCAFKAAGKKPSGLDKLSKNLDGILKDTKQIDKCAEFLSAHKSFPLVGSNYCYILAKEGALKIKETSYIDANAYALGEFFHGHIALLNQKNAVVEIFTSDSGEFEIKNLNKIKNNYKPKTVTIADFESNLDGDCKIIFPQFEDDLTKFLAITVILQLLALKIATKLRRDVDKPHGLSKVVKD